MKMLVLQTMRPDCSKLAINRKNDSDTTIFRHGIIVNFFFEVVLFLLSSLLAGPSQYHHWFWRDWLEIPKSEIP